MYTRGGTRVVHVLDSMRGMVRAHGQDGEGWERVCQGGIEMVCSRWCGGDGVGWERAQAWTTSSRQCRGDGTRETVQGRWRGIDGAGQEMAQVRAILRQQDQDGMGSMVWGGRW